MTFLDEAPLNLTRPEVIQLRDLFAAAYRRPTEAQELADSAGIVPGTFPWYDNMRTTFTELLKVMAAQRKLRKLVEKAAGDPTIEAFQPRFQEMLEAQPALTTVQRPGQDWWKGADKDARVARKLHLERMMEKRSRMLDIAVARQVVQMSRSVAKLTVRFTGGKATGTGFVIQPDLILTNHHNVVHDDYGKLEAVTAEFDYEPSFAGKALVLQGKPESIAGSAPHDWAVIGLERAIDREPIALGTPYDIGKDDTIIVIQHPLGAFKQFTIDPMSLQYADDEIVQYLADTQDGSSGSPVFSKAMHLIALHHAEAEVKIDVDGREDVVWRNEGIRIERVMDDLKSNGIPFIDNKS